MVEAARNFLMGEQRMETPHHSSNDNQRELLERRLQDLRDESACLIAALNQNSRSASEVRDMLALLNTRFLRNVRLP